MKKERLKLVMVLVIIVLASLIVPMILQSATVANEVEAESRVFTGELANTQFYENLGQFPDERVRYYGSIPGGYIGFAQGSVLIWFGESHIPFLLSFINSNEECHLSATDEVAHRSNYFLGQRGTFTDVKGYHKIKFCNVWDEIDLVFSTRTDGAEYEFIVKSGADPEQIALNCEGYRSISYEDTKVIIERSSSNLVFDSLFVYQKHAEIEAEFVERENGVFGFKIGSYDRSETLVIDPLIYSTYIGGSSFERGYSIAVDRMGNSYVCGKTKSSDFSIVNGYDDTFNEDFGYYDCFVLKLNHIGNSLIYSTFIGGGHDDAGYSITVDSVGCAYVCGDTESNDFPTVNAYDSTYKIFDCFILKLSNTGDSLIYSTLFGGSNIDYASSIAIDSAGNAYVCGDTRSFDFPVVNAFNETYTPGVTGVRSDCYVLKLNASGESLVYSTYIGGGEIDIGSSIVVDEVGNAIVCGFTESSNFPIINAYSDSLLGFSDSFLLKLNGSGNSLLFSTYIGGSLPDEASSLAIDSTGNIYMCGQTKSADFPILNAYDSSYQGVMNNAYLYDGYILKIAANGQSLIYSTYFGGTDTEYCTSIDVDPQGNAYVCGITWSSDLPIVDAYDDSFNGDSTDGFVLKLNSTGDGLVYSTFIGGSSWDIAYSIAVDSNGSAYVYGQTESSDFPTINSYDEALSGVTDCFIIKIIAGPQSIDYAIPILTMTFLSVTIVSVFYILWKRRRNRTAS